MASIRLVLLLALSTAGTLAQSLTTTVVTATPAPDEVVFITTACSATCPSTDVMGNALIESFSCGNTCLFCRWNWPGGNHFAEYDTTTGAVTSPIGVAANPLRAAATCATSTSTSTIYPSRTTTVATSTPTPGEIVSTTTTCSSVCPPTDNSGNTLIENFSCGDNCLFCRWNWPGGNHFAEYFVDTGAVFSPIGVAANPSIAAVACTTTAATSFLPTSASSSLASTTASSSTSASSSSSTPALADGWAIAIPCATDIPSRILTDVYITNSEANTPLSCTRQCFALGFAYAGVESGDECYCGSDLVSDVSATHISDCDAPCTGDTNITCGASWRMQVYNTTLAPPDDPGRILTDVQLETAYEAVCNATNSALGRSDIRDDVDELSARAIAINVAFEQIGDQLAAIDAQKLSSVTIFVPTWQPITQNWTDILRDSVDTAKNTAAYCTEFTTVIMPFVANLDGPVPTNISVEVLNGYRDMANALADEARATSDAFTELRNQIAAFTLTFRAFAVQQTAIDEAAIDELNTDIALLQAKIAGYGSEISALLISIAVKTDATIVAAATFYYIFPRFSDYIAGVGFEAVARDSAVLVDTLQARADASAELRDDQVDLAHLQSQLPAIAAANTTLYSITQKAVTLATQLTGINSIWNAIKSDCNNVAQYIRTLNSTIGHIPGIYWKTQNNVHCLYEAMADAMNSYAANLTASLPQPTLRRRDLNFPEKLHSDVQALVASAKAKINASA